LVCGNTTVAPLFRDATAFGIKIEKVRKLGAEMSHFASKCNSESADFTGIPGELSGLKILWLHGRAGSSPARGTIKSTLNL